MTYNRVPTAIRSWRGGEGGGKGGRGGREELCIKSNNPHLAGAEKSTLTKVTIRRFTSLYFHVSCNGGSPWRSFR